MTEDRIVIVRREFDVFLKRGKVHRITYDAGNYHAANFQELIEILRAEIGPEPQEEY